MPLITRAKTSLQREFVSRTVRPAVSTSFTIVVTSENISQVLCGNHDAGPVTLAAAHRRFCFTPTAETGNDPSRIFSEVSEEIAVQF